jgi:hypothetical protein
MELLETGVRELISEELAHEKRWRRIFSDLARRRADPHCAARRALRKILRKKG